MPNLSPIQPAFNGGETSGRVRGRVDLDLYKRSLSECTNFIPLPQGSLLMRAGTELVRALPGAKRAVTFRSASGGDFFLAFGGGVLRVYSVNGAGVSLNPETVTETEIITNAGFSTPAGAGWTGVLADFGTPGVVTLRREAANPTDPSLKQSFNVVTEQDVNLDVLFSSFLTSGSRARVRVGTADEAGDLLDWSGVWVNVAFQLNHLRRTIHAPAGRLYITITAPGVYDPSNPTALQGFTLTTVSLKGVVTTGGSTDIPIPWTDDELVEVQHISESGADRMVFAHRNKAPWFLKYNGANAWDFGNVVFTSPPASWTGSKWPGAIEFYNGKAYYSGTPGEGNRVIASKAVDPTNPAVGGLFDLTTGANPGDAIDVKVATKGEIRWVKGGRTLLAGTDIGEHSISGSKGTPLVGDTQVRDESAFGAARVQPVFAGAHVLFASPDRERVRALSFDLQTNGWEQKDVTFLADHILAGKVQELHFTWAPDGMLLAKTQDGEVIGCSFTPGEGIIAWFRVSLPATVIRSAAVMRSDAGTSLWLITERGDATFLERLPLYDDETVRFLDYSIAGVLDENGSFPYGVYDDVKVRVLVGGALAGDFAAAGNRVTLGAEYAGMQYVAGFPFLARATTLPLEGGNPEGTSQGMKVHYTDISARLNNSAAPLLNGERAGEGRPFVKPLEAWELRTEDVKAKSLKVEEGGVITIEQDLPFRTEVCAVYARALVSKV